MRNFDELRAEIFSRSEKKKMRERKRKRIIACAGALCICIAISGIYTLLPKAQRGGSATSSQEEASNLPVITADKLDGYGLNLEGLLSRNEKYLSPLLKEKMEEYKDTDCRFRVIVEIFMGAEDYNEYEVTDEDMLVLKKEEEKAFETYNNLLESLIGVEDNDKRAEIVEEANKWETKARELSRQYDDFVEQDSERFYSAIAESRLMYAKEIGAANISEVSASSDISGYFAYKNYAYFMELSSDMIEKLAEKGGYLFRLAPSEREEGYSVKIADHLTNILEAAEDDELIQVKVVCTIDRYNQFVSDGMVAKRDYNNELYKKFTKTRYPEDEIPTWEEYNDEISKYIDNIVSRNGLTDRRITGEDLNIHIYESVYGRHYEQNTVHSEDCQKSIAAGFEIKAAKSEILSLAEDTDIKLICLSQFDTDGQFIFSESE